jgi:hypothetical protein
MEFAKHETIIVPPNGRNGTQKAEKLLNDSPIRVQIVDSTWNKVIIREEGFDVDGHLRLQAKGEGRKDRELIWINGYKKHGYKRGIDKSKLNTT